VRYSHLIRFLLPLVITMAVQEVGGQVLNGGIARAPQATQTLASFGLAWGLVSFLTSPMLQTRQLGLVLVDSRHAFKRVLVFVLFSGLLLAGILAGLALSPFGVWVIEDLHGAGGSLGTGAREALFWLIPIPLLRGLTLFYSGLLLRIRRTDLVSYAMLAAMAASILAVFALLPTGLVQARPILLPLLVTYAGGVAELGIVLFGYRSHVGRSLGEAGRALSLGYVLRFFWPLALIMAIQGLSRPLINLFVSRGPDGAQALAVLTIVYALGHLPYGWLNELRSLPTAFRGGAYGLSDFRRFAAACGLVSFGIMVVLFWTPVRNYILGSLLGVDAELAASAAMPLVIFAFFPLVVAARAYLHGVGLLEHRTQAMAPSAPSRITAILVTLIILPALGIHGATRGIAALLCGFVVETLVVWWGIHRKATGQRKTGRLADQAP
jgi:hypothetical protein